MGGNWGVIESNWETVCTRLGASAASVRKAALARLKRPPLGHLLDGLEGALGRGRLAHCSGGGGGAGGLGKAGNGRKKSICRAMDGQDGACVAHGEE